VLTHSNCLSITSTRLTGLCFSCTRSLICCALGMAGTDGEDDCWTAATLRSLHACRDLTVHRGLAATTRASCVPSLFLPSMDASCCCATEWGYEHPASSGCCTCPCAGALKAVVRHISLAIDTSLHSEFYRHQHVAGAYAFVWCCQSELNLANTGRGDSHCWINLWLPRAPIGSDPLL